MAMATMCTFLSNIHDMPHWKCVLQYLSNCTIIGIPGQYYTSEKQKCVQQYVLMYIYLDHGVQLMSIDHMMGKQHVFLIFPTIETRTKYCRKELILRETSIAQFNKKFYIPYIQQLVTNFPRVCIFGNYRCVKETHEAFQRICYYQCVKCHSYYSDFLASIFYNQIQS